MKHVTHFQAAAVTNLTCAQQGWRANRDGAELNPATKKCEKKQTNEQTTATADHTASPQRPGEPSWLLPCTDQSLQTDWGRAVTTTSSRSRSAERTCWQVWLFVFPTV